MPNRPYTKSPKQVQISAQACWCWNSANRHSIILFNFSSAPPGALPFTNPSLYKKKIKKSSSPHIEATFPPARCLGSPPPLRPRCRGPPPSPPPPPPSLTPSRGRWGSRTLRPRRRTLCRYGTSPTPYSRTLAASPRHHAAGAWVWRRRRRIRARGLDWGWISGWVWPRHGRSRDGGLD